MRVSLYVCRSICLYPPNQDFPSVTALYNYLSFSHSAFVSLYHVSFSINLSQTVSVCLFAWLTDSPFVLLRLSSSTSNARLLDWPQLLQSLHAFLATCQSSAWLCATSPAHLHVCMFCLIAMESRREMTSLKKRHVSASSLCLYLSLSFCFCVCVSQSFGLSRSLRVSVFRFCSSRSLHVWSSSSWRSTRIAQMSQ